MREGNGTCLTGVSAGRSSRGSMVFRTDVWPASIACQAAVWPKSSSKAVSAPLLTSRSQITRFPGIISIDFLYMYIRRVAPISHCLSLWTHNYHFQQRTWALFCRIYLACPPEHRDREAPYIQNDDLSARHRTEEFDHPTILRRQGSGPRHSERPLWKWARHIIPMSYQFNKPRA